MSDVHVAAFMPVLNEGERIERAIESLQCQTHPISKLVVVDGGSTDATHDVVNRVADTVDFSIDLHVCEGAGVRESSQFGAEAAVAVLLGDGDVEWADGDHPSPDTDAGDDLASAADGGVDVPAADAGAEPVAPASAEPDRVESGPVAPASAESERAESEPVTTASAEPDRVEAGPVAPASAESEPVAPASTEPERAASQREDRDDGVVVRLEGDSALAETFVETAVAHLANGRYSSFGAPVRPHDPSTRRVLKRLFTIAQNAEGLPKGRGMAFRASDFRAVDGYRLRPDEDLSTSPIDCLEDGILVAKLLERGPAAFSHDTCVYSSVPSTTATSPRRWRTALRIEREMGPTHYFTRIANPLNTALYAGKWLAGLVGRR